MLPLGVIACKLESGAKFDFAHFWEDICFKNGPLVNPDVFKARVAPHYARITALVRRHGIDIVSLDCDGMIDALLPTWLGAMAGDQGFAMCCSEHPLHQHGEVVLAYNLAIDGDGMTRRAPVVCKQHLHG